MALIMLYLFSDLCLMVENFEAALEDDFQSHSYPIISHDTYYILLSTTNLRAGPYTPGFENTCMVRRPSTVCNAVSITRRVVSFLFHLQVAFHTLVQPTSGSGKVTHATL